MSHDETFSDLATGGALLFGPGSLLGIYRLESPLGRGGMGQVWKAFDTHGQRFVALKLLPPEFRGNAEAVEQVRDAFQVVHALTHQHICKTIGLFDDPSHGPYIVMDYVPGITLSQFQRQFPDRRLPVELVVQILKPIAEALDYAHQKIVRHDNREQKGVLHRDVKPQNILLIADGQEVQEVWLIDFGLAAEIRSTFNRHTRGTADTRGTRPYMSPEQLSGKRNRWDGRTDQYSLAIVAYELLAGHLPFDSEDDFALIMAINQEPIDPVTDVTDAVNSALLQALAKQRDERFSKCCEFITGLAKTRPAEKVEVSQPTDELPTLEPDEQRSASKTFNTTRQANGTQQTKSHVVNRKTLLGLLKSHFRRAPDTYIHPSIPKRKLANTTQQYQQFLATGEAILCLYDSTVFGGAKEGFVITDSGIAYKSLGDPPGFMRFQHVRPESVKYKENLFFGKKGKVSLISQHASVAKALKDVLTDLWSRMDQQALALDDEQSPALPVVKREETLSALSIVTASKQQATSGKGAAGLGNEAASIELILGSKEGSVGEAFLQAFISQGIGQSNLFAMLTLNLLCKPATLMVPRISLRDGKHIAQVYGPAQYAIARAISDHLATEVSNEHAENLACVCSLVVSPTARDQQAIVQNNYEATSIAIQDALRNGFCLDSPQGHASRSQPTWLVGEALVGDGNEVAHIEVIVENRIGLVGSACANALSVSDEQHPRLIAERVSGQPCEPQTVLLTKVTLKNDRQKDHLDTARRAVAQAVTDSVDEGIISKESVNDLAILCAAFVHWMASDDQKIYQFNYEATKLSIARAMHREPSLEEVLAKKDNAKHPFVDSSVRLRAVQTR